MSKKKNLVHQPHDSFTKRMLSDIEVAKSLMKFHIPSDVVGRIDWQTVELTNKSFVTEDLSQLHSDVIYKCTIDNKESYILMLVEHQSTPDEWLPLRVLGYNVQLMEQHLKEGNKKLPIIINVCIYAGQESPYPYSTDIFDLFSIPELARQKMFKPIDLTDLSVLSQEELLKDGTAGLVKVLLKQGIERNYLNWVKNNKEIVVRLIGGIFGMSSVIYILGTDEVSEPEELLKAIIEATPEQKDMLMTAAQKLEQRGEKRGIQQGMEKGMENKAIEIAKGMVKEGLAVSLIQKLTGLSAQAIEDLKKG